MPLKTGKVTPKHIFSNWEKKKNQYFEELYIKALKQIGKEMQFDS